MIFGTQFVSIFIFYPIPNVTILDIRNKHQILYLPILVFLKYALCKQQEKCVYRNTSSPRNIYVIIASRKRNLHVLYVAS